MTDRAIRPATGDDAPACAAILNAWIDDTPWMTRDIAPKELEDVLRNGLPLREAYVIGSPVTGYLSMEADISHIWGFYVATPREGLGSALLDHVKHGRSFLRLNTHEANTSAHAFYASQGFVQTGDAWLGEDGINEIRMEWRA